MWCWARYRVWWILECAAQCGWAEWLILANWVVCQTWRLCQILTHEAQVAIRGHRAVWVLHFATSAVFCTRRMRQVWRRKPCALSLRSHWGRAPTASDFTTIVLSCRSLPLLTSQHSVYPSHVSSGVEKGIPSCPPSQGKFSSILSVHFPYNFYKLGVKNHLVLLMAPQNSLR